MRILNTGKGNVTSLRIGQIEFLFSYQTLVAFDSGSGIYVTKEKFSVTTSKHINAWLDNRSYTIIPKDNWDDWHNALSRKFGDAIALPKF